MKKLLLSSAAVCGLALSAGTAHADGLKLDVGGWFKGYGVYMDQDEGRQRNGAALGTALAGEAREFDFARHTELHFTGETTLDNGLTVGFHLETEVDGDDSAAVEESYAYFSGNWGRVNFGAEDGAAYLLQVEAPSADSNIDGLRQLIQPVNYNFLTGGNGDDDADNVTGLAAGTGVAFDYQQNVTGYDDKLTYLTPILSGFQLGLSYTPDIGDANDFEGNRASDVQNAFGQAYEGAVRYEGQFEGVGVALGAGFTHRDLEARRSGVGTVDFTDDRQAWNVGVDFDFGPFGLGVAYVEDNNGEAERVAAGNTGTVDDEEIIVVGADYTVGQFKFGASYYNSENSIVNGTTFQGLETDRYTGGVVYTYGPGMTFRGSVSYIEHDGAQGAFDTSSDDLEATSVLLGTQIKF